jgi:hypothetical protein
MSLGEAIAIYIVLGAAVAIGVWMGRVSAGPVARSLEAIGALAFWPFWLPLLLAAGGRGRGAIVEWGGDGDDSHDADDALSAAIDDVERELHAAARSLAGWAGELFALEHGRLAELRRAWREQAASIRDMDRILARAGVGPSPAPSTGGACGDDDGAPWARHEDARRRNLLALERARDRARHELLGSLAWVRELVSMLYLARHTGAPPARARELVTQIATAVESIRRARERSETLAVDPHSTSSDGCATRSTRGRTRGL